MNLEPIDCNLGAMGDHSVDQANLSGSRHQPCSLYWDPICGSNSKTYRNLCEFEKAKLHDQQYGKKGQALLTIAYLGTCRHRPNALSHIAHVECPLQCSSTLFQPVCGSNGVTFINSCYLKMLSCQLARHGRRLYQFYKGPCLGTELTPSCDQNCSYAQMAILRNNANRPQDIPICTSHGHIYLDPCQFKKEMCSIIGQHNGNYYLNNQYHGKDMVFYGRCSGVSELTGIDFMVHYNRWFQKGTSGTRKVSIHCQHHCFNTMMPICSQDGREYSNYCQLKKRQCSNTSGQHQLTPSSLSHVQHWRSCN